MNMNTAPYLEDLKKRLERYRGHWPEISRRANVSYSWITKLMQGYVDNPRVVECERVRQVLDAMDGETFD